MNRQVVLAEAPPEGGILILCKVRLPHSSEVLDMGSPWIVPAMPNHRFFLNVEIVLHTGPCLKQKLGLDRQFH